MTVFEKTDRFLRNLYETAFYFAAMALRWPKTCRG